mgnify:FL=1
MAGTAKEKLFELISDMNGSSEDEVPSIVGMEYGGGLDSAYMTLSQRRDSAFAAPDATSAFSSPMSMGGLPTVYRFYGGTVDEVGGSEEYGGFDADLTDEEDSYREAENYFQSTQAGDGGADLPDYAYGITDDRRQDLFGPEGSLDSEDALSSGARSVLLSTLRDMTGNWDDAEEAFKNMTTPEMMNFERAYSGKSSLDGSTGYRYGGPAGTLQDILENRASDQFGLGDIISKDKEEKKFDKFVKETYGDKEVSESFMDKIGLGGLYDTLTDIFSIQSEVSPTTLEGITKQLEGTGATFTPVNSFLAGAMDLALPLAAKGLANLTGGGKTIGTITTADGMSFNLSDAGKLSMNMPMSEYDEGSGATPVKRTVKKKKETKEEKEETPKTGMAALLARRPEPKKRLDTLAGSQDIYKSIYNRPFRTV